jgi:hypothetical protein
MAVRKAFDPWGPKIVHWMGASIFALLLLISDHSNAAIYINQDSRVVILSGYSSDLTKQELPAINEQVEYLLQGLSEGLEDMFDANVEHLSEKGLATQLELRKLGKGEEAIKEFLRIGKYTHLVVADVQRKGEKHGSVSMQIFTLPSDGTPTESVSTRKITLTASQSDDDINNSRLAILREFSRFRPPDAPKRVRVLCILPRNNIVLDDRSFTHQLQLERILSEYVTLQIIDIHQSKRMQDAGYLPTVHRRSWDFERVDNGKTLRCKAAAPADGVVPASNKLPDYVVDGKVGIFGPKNGFDRVDLKIQVTRELPTHCEVPILIVHPFKPNSYDGNGKQNLSSEFSEKILPPLYEQQWLASLDTCNK